MNYCYDQIICTPHFFICIFLFNSCKQDVIVTKNDSVNSNSKSNTITQKNGPLSVVYVEVNSNNILNSGCYTLLNSGQQLFDIAIIFAANINYDVAHHRAVEYNNDNVSRVLQNRNTYIKPLQDKGIKVLLTILGNHEGAGISNFTSRKAALDFAKQLRDTVNYYHLDGVDFDDEYADYGDNGLPQPNDSSFTILLAACRELMPKKILSFYYYGPATNKLSYKGINAGRFLNYSWNAIYGTYDAPVVPGMNKSQLAPAAVWIQNTSASTAKSLANRTKMDSYGAYLYYDLTNVNATNYFSGISNTLYRDSTYLDPDCLQPF
ncbi:MAG: endo-beta-N-acetylglucosaminidase H [Parafilimonas sp.]